MMRNKTLTGLLALALCSCGGGKGSQPLQVAGIGLDSVARDTVVALASGKDAPKCELSVHVLYAKGGKAASPINNALLHAGLLSPDYLSLGGEDFAMDVAVDSFVRRFTAEYVKEYGALYRNDQGHAPSYNVLYKVRTQANSQKDHVLTYVAEVYSYAGGAHGISQTLAWNFDTTTGKRLTLDTLFKHGYEEPLRTAILEQMAKDLDTEGTEGLKEKGILAADGLYVSNNFILADKSLTFIYCEDEIAPHAMGEIRVEIDRKKYEKLLR